ncbi:MAG: PH domain-containing protein [Pseudonocardia sp.]
MSDWSPARGLVALAWAGVVVALGWLVVLLLRGGDPGGLLFAGVTTVGLGFAALYGTRARPRLRADADGLTVGGLWGARHHPWPLVRDVRVRRVRRLGRETRLLELDSVTAAGDEQLVVFGRLDLDADPEDVAERIVALRPPRS